MANPPTPAPNPDDDTRAESNIKKWVHEVLDERDAKAVADKAQAEAEETAQMEANRKASFMQTLFGG